MEHITLFLAILLSFFTSNGAQISMGNGAKYCSLRQPRKSLNLKGLLLAYTYTCHTYLWEVKKKNLYNGRSRVLTGEDLPTITHKLNLLINEAPPDQMFSKSVNQYSEIIYIALEQLLGLNNRGIYRSFNTDHDQFVVGYKKTTQN